MNSATFENLPGTPSWSQCSPQLFPRIPTTQSTDGLKESMKFSSSRHGLLKERLQC